MKSITQSTICPEKNTQPDRLFDASIVWPCFLIFGSLLCFERFLKKIQIMYSTSEVPGSSFFDSDSGSETVQSRNSVPIQIPRLSMARTQFRVRFRDCTGLELDSDSGSETELDSDSEMIPSLGISVLIPDIFT